jgi:hypothetical protein
MLAAEIREQESHTAKFTIIGLSEGRILEENIVMEEKWWVGLEYFRWPCLFIRTFEDEFQSPGRNLIAFDILRKSVNWALRDFEPVRWGENNIQGYLTIGESREFNIINMDSGEITHKSEIPSTLALSYKEPDLSGLYYPAQYLEGDDNFETVRQFLSRRNIEACYAIEYLDTGDLIFIGYYIKHGQGLANFLLISDQTGGQVFTDKTGDALSGIGLETYFVMGKHLIYTVDKSILKIVTLP